MRFRAGGIRFSVGPDAAIVPAEREVVAPLDPDDSDGPPPVRVELLDAPPWTSDDPSLFPRWEPAVQRWAGDRLLCSHALFTAEIDPFTPRAGLFRREERAYPLGAVIRTAMMARLPVIGGLPLHAAGIVADGRAIAFFGPSGAGKSTLAATAPSAVLSDELVAVAPGRPFALVRSGFWGEGRESGRCGPAPLVALVDLAKGTAFRLTRLRPAEAAGRVLASTPVPLATPLWSCALSVVAELVQRVPVYRMEWTPAEPPWERLAGALAEATART